MKIVIIGAGNVAYHLGKVLWSKGHAIMQIVGRSPNRAKQLADLLQTTYTTDLSCTLTTADLYILAVSDNAIEEVALSLSRFIMPQALVVHTSGATPSTVLKVAFERYGVFYPLQSFSIGKAVDFSTVPICIDAVYLKDSKQLEQLAQTISTSVHKITDNQRAALHLAAVFVNNFTNHLLDIGQQLCQQNQVDFDILKPLIQETVHKITIHSPFEMQTGPARRNDKKTIARHLVALEEQANFQQLYQLLSDSITKRYH